MSAMIVGVGREAGSGEGGAVLRSTSSDAAGGRQVEVGPQGAAAGEGHLADALDAREGDRGEAGAVAEGVVAEVD